jgi:Domain of unknown function (DUF4157)
MSTHAHASSKDSSAMPSLKQVNSNQFVPVEDELLRSSGQPLDTATRVFIEPRFGHAFSEVRVHPGASADTAPGAKPAAHSERQELAVGEGRFVLRPNLRRSTNDLQHSGFPEITTGQRVEKRLLSAVRFGSEDRLEREADSVALHGIGAPSGEKSVRDHVGHFLGFDFSSVRLHREKAEVEAQGAHAMAEGSNIYLAPGRYRPDVPLGRALLAHELAHVAQQGAAPRRPGPGSFREAIGQLGDEHSSVRLAERAGTIADPQTQLTPAPLGMRQRCVAGCSSCSKEEDSSAATGQSAPVSTASSSAPSTPQPTHAVGPDQATAGAKVVRLSWTVDDGPTPFTPGMSKALTPRAATWFIMSDMLGTGTARSTAISQLVKRQTAGDEIAIHSMHPTISHSAWFPISLTGVNKGYNTTAAAMADLTSFTKELRAAKLNVHFGRMPGGELSEVKKYIENEGGSASTSDSVAQALLSGKTPPSPAPAKVATDVALVMSTLKTLDLHLWGGSASGAEVTRNTWEAESSGVTPARTDDVVRRFTGVVDKLAAGTRKTPGSFVILAHDTTKADVAQAEANIKSMETYATGKGVRVEYYRMADLYQLLRGTPP